MDTPLQLSQVAANLAPAFAAGFAVQQSLHIADSLFVSETAEPKLKKGIMGLISLALGLLFSLAGLSVLGAIVPQGSSAAHPGLWKFTDVAISALVISAGTEGFNSIMKFFSYQKESAKADAAVKKARAAKTVAPAKPGALDTV
jgi:hypothetical protein